MVLRLLTHKVFIEVKPSAQKAENGGALWATPRKSAITNSQGNQQAATTKQQPATTATTTRATVSATKAPQVVVNLSCILFAFRCAL